jgi:hypothetical protein
LTSLEGETFAPASRRCSMSSCSSHEMYPGWANTRRKSVAQDSRPGARGRSSEYASCWFTGRMMASNGATSERRRPGSRKARTRRMKVSALPGGTCQPC